MPADNELHKAAHKGDLKACKELIEGSVGEETPLTVNDPGASDRRPLHRAAGAGHLDICEYFISIGAEIDGIDKSGRTSLHWAAISGHVPIVKLLLDHGANILAATTSQTTSLHCAVEASKVEVVRVLMERVHGNEEKKTALTMAKNNEGKTAWDLAAGAKNQAVCQCLKEMGDTNGASSACVIC